MEKYLITQWVAGAPMDIEYEIEVLSHYGAAAHLNFLAANFHLLDCEVSPEIIDHLHLEFTVRGNKNFRTVHIEAKKVMTKVDTMLEHFKNKEENK